MIPAWQLISISVLYIGSLFWVAWYGDKRAQKKKPIHNSALVYSLSLAVYCTSWTFYGVVGQASTSGWSFLAVYVGPVIFIWFFWRLLAKIIRIAKEKRITSIADFIATRYGRDNSLAVLVTLVAMLGVVPYIALQLKAVTVAFNLLSSPHELGALAIASTEAWHDTALYVSVAMALFVIIFGTRDIDASEQHPGMMLAVAFESLVKLIAFMAVGIWVVCYLFEQPLDLFTLARNTSPDHPLFKTDIISLSFVLQSLLAAFAMLCLPRQFQVGVIENESIQHVKAARWMFPAYLMLMLLFVVPIALSGNLFMKDLGFGPDTYVLSLPIAFDQELLAIIAFIGGTSAATGMIIVATIAISTMVSNELILPMVFHRSQSQADLQQSSNIRTLVLTVRRLVIVAMILGSYLFYRTVGEFESLAAIGLLSFAVVAQFAPSLIGGLLWQRANHQGAMAGIISGTFIWFYTLLLPVLDNSSGGLIGSPSLAMMGENLDNFSSGVILSLLVNIFCFIFFSIISSASVRERMLASDFSSAKGIQQNQPTTALNCKVDDVRVVLERILGLQKTESFFISYQYQHGVQYNHAPASDELLHDAEKMLGSVVGSSSARVIFSTLLGGEQIQIRDLTFIASEASQAFAMSQEQLQAAVENLHQGVSVIDKDLNLVAWNSRYLQLFEYPESFIQAGKPIHEIIAFNARRGFCGPGEIEAQVHRRMKFLRNGSAHQFERTLPNGLVISMQGHPMPDGGFVTSFTDITAHRRAEQTLKQANIKLERRVEESSQELEDLTSQLIEANHSKSRFLAATGHDLMQPLNAAKLFASTLAQQSLNTEQQELLSHLEGSLQSAEDVLSILVEISKLDAGAMEPDIRPISLSAVLKPLRDEFTALAAEKGLSLTVRVCDAWVLSDAHWLRRIIQNLLGNAVRYTQSGGVLLGCRKRGNKLAIEVWDTGPGIPKEKLPEIFGEFKRLHTEKQDTKGLGLGLAIVDRMANQLDHDINVASVVGKGTRFRITLSLTEAQQDEQKSAPSVLNQAASFEGMKTFCIDNDPEVLTAMNALLNSWQCDVYSCSDIATAKQVPFKPEIMLCDYQLDNDETGIQTMTLLRQQFDDPALPGILISADPRPEVADEARSLGFYFLSKPVRPAALRALIRKLVKK
ncbi:NahK/ErcS family hybrid sensor histidine kinase/response regulator [Bacterioplanoides sp. SCSIO 12839]|uniref:PAS domain-containing hybrid sensor histidine kinase/response regulator n=1 Tax=Bacterioplanoides sp. SCSIO 12839 TaxID=2829569 RepID=UPI002102FCE7|nr:NahK/ErcS family hybrid sensor histidine kinase/response regulator [Bacterioplanoides sp. SCSIO 12839]UTW47433.1 hybrid sensor histidine kinase/response regulator [Bacterioplanoides sp. SCSIO 12839]